MLRRICLLFLALTLTLSVPAFAAEAPSFTDAQIASAKQLAAHPVRLYALHGLVQAKRIQCIAGELSPADYHRWLSRRYRNRQVYGQVVPVTVVEPQAFQPAPDAPIEYRAKKRIEMRWYPVPAYACGSFEIAAVGILVSK